jgi:hypothetical protein
MLFTSEDLKKALALPALVALCFIIACAFVDRSHILWPVLACLLILGGIGGSAFLRARFSAPKAELIPMVYQAEQPAVKPDANAQYVQDLFSPYTQCAAMAAEHLGKIGDAAVVPSLISVLDRSAWRDEPGWEQVCESIIVALVSIGDGRTLPALNRISGARDPKFREFVASAIASIADAPARSLCGPEPTALRDYSIVSEEADTALAPRKSNRPTIESLDD